jgi:hypothetical protein
MLPTHFPNPESGDGGRRDSGHVFGDDRKIPPPSDPKNFKQNHHSISHKYTNYVSPTIDVNTPTSVEAAPAQTADDDINLAGSNASPLNVHNSSRSSTEIVFNLEFMFPNEQHPTAIALRAGFILHQMFSQFYNLLTIYHNRGWSVRFRGAIAQMIHLVPNLFTGLHLII